MIISFKKKQRINSLISFCLETVFKLFVFLIPSQLAFHFWPKWSYVYGIRIDYLSPALYLTDILILVIIFLWLVELITNKTFKPKISSPYLCFFIFIILNTILSSSFYISVFRWIKFIEIGLICLFVSKYKKLKVKKWIIEPLIFSSIFFIFIALIQFINKKTIGGIFYFLGERTFSIATPGIALINIFGRHFLRAYSTFSHPNALAGFMGIVLLLYLNFIRAFKKTPDFQSGDELNAHMSSSFGRGNRGLKSAEDVIKDLKKTLATYLIIALILVGIIISFSKTIFIILLFAFIYWKYRSKFKLIEPSIALLILISSILLSLFLLTTNQYFLNNKFFIKENVVHRLYLINTSAKIINNNPILGVGLNNFIKFIPKYSVNSNWILQPVHNIYLLILSEMGFVGLIVFFILIFKIIDYINKDTKGTFYVILLFILMSGFVDHYWLTSQQNIILESLVLGLVLRK